MATRAGGGRDRGLAGALALAEAGRWGEAAERFEALAREAGEARRLEEARERWAQAGDAFRRDDRPARSARALKAAFDLVDPTDPRRAHAAAGLAAALIDAGEPVPAEILARETLASARELGPRLLLVDVLLGSLVLLGRAPEAEGPLLELTALVAALPPAARPLADATLAFRRAARHRLRGELDQAEALLLDVEARMALRKETTGAAAAAAAELGEIRNLRCEDDAGAEATARAARAWTAAGRRAGLYRCEAALIRAALTRGETPMARALDGPITYARERGMPLLEAELRIARGAARARALLRGGEEDLDQAVLLAERASAVLLEGRARLTRRRSGFLRDDLARTRACLETDAVWSRVAALPQIGEAGPW